MGKVPADHAVSSKPGWRHAVTGEEGTFVPLRYFHVDCAASSVVFCTGVPAPPPEARQLPPRSLSSEGLISSMELPCPGTFASPTVGHGKPSLNSTTSSIWLAGVRSVSFSPYLESEVAPSARSGPMAPATLNFVWRKVGFCATTAKPPGATLVAGKTKFRLPPSESVQPTRFTALVPAL